MGKRSPKKPKLGKLKTRGLENSPGHQPEPGLIYPGHLSAFLPSLLSEKPFPFPILAGLVIKSLLKVVTKPYHPHHTAQTTLPTPKPGQFPPWLFLTIPSASPGDAAGARGTGVASAPGTRGDPGRSRLVELLADLWVTKELLSRLEG